MKILLIEDDSSIRNVLRLSFESEGHVVDEAEDGDHGSYIARTNHYDVIIVDNMLPKKRGKEVCKEIREAGIHIPVLFLSMRNELLEKIDILEAGADDYMTKPFSFEELKARIHVLLRRPAILAEDRYTVRDITINPERHLVTKNGDVITLTRKEFALLELLIKNKEKVVSRGQIIEHVWDMHANPFSNTVEAHILNLRKKLSDTKRRLIRSIPGRGYKITELC